MTHTQLVLVDIENDGTAIVTLNRPEKRNALSAALIADLIAAFRALEKNDAVRAIILTGRSGGPFSGGSRVFHQSDVDLRIDLLLLQRAPT